jgi:chromosomal replication initiator protein
MILVRDIQRATAEHYGIPIEAMNEPLGFGASNWDRAHPRQLAMLLSRRMTKHSKQRIGHFFNRDHSTVIHGLKRARRRCLADRASLKALCEIRARVLEAA